jgi:hypothetical protein
MEARSQLRHRPTLEGSLLLLFTLYISSNGRPVPEHWQLRSNLWHRPMDMPTFPRVRISATWLAILLISCLQTLAQPATDPAAAPPVKVSSIVQPALGDVQTSMSGLNIAHWKAPGEVKSAAQQNATSIQRDLTDTLPGLLSQADASPGAVPASFSVYRNLDALYDVLLRVYGTASLAAPQNEADSVFSALQKLEAARSQLGDAILSASRDHEVQLTKLQAALKAAATAAPPPPAPSKPAVIDDGPAPAPSVKKKKKPAPKPPVSDTSGTPTG